MRAVTIWVNCHIIRSSGFNLHFRCRILRELSQRGFCLNFCCRSVIRSYDRPIIFRMMPATTHAVARFKRTRLQAPGHLFWTVHSRGPRAFLFLISQPVLCASLAMDLQEEAWLAQLPEQLRQPTQSLLDQLAEVGRLIATSLTSTSKDRTLAQLESARPRLREILSSAGHHIPMEDLGEILNCRLCRDHGQRRAEDVVEVFLQLVADRPEEQVQAAEQNS